MEQLEEVYKVNVLGPLLVTRAFFSLLLAGQQRTIINIASMAGSSSLHQTLLQKPETSVFASSLLGYATSKAALNMGKSRCQALLFCLSEASLPHPGHPTQATGDGDHLL